MRFPKSNQPRARVRSRGLLRSSRSRWLLPGAATFGLVAMIIGAAVIAPTVAKPASAAVPGPAQWTLLQGADPAPGTVVYPDEEIHYLLTIASTSSEVVHDVVSSVDLSDVLDDAILALPLPDGVTVDGTRLSWRVGDLQPRQVVSTQYSVVVNQGDSQVELVSVATPGPGGECVVAADCTVRHRSAQVDLTISKTAATASGGAVDAGRDATIDYEVLVTNVGTDPATEVMVWDVLPAGLTLEAGSEVLPSDAWSLRTLAGNEVVFDSTAELAPGESARLGFRVKVGELERPDPLGPIPDIESTACVGSREADTNPDDNCDAVATPVKSIAATTTAVCLANAPYLEYSLRAYNVDDPAAVALIWWSAAAYEERDVSIPAADESALLADGAARVDYVPLPPGYRGDDLLEGRVLWPGAAVDAAGEGIAWPGWRQLPTGQWVLDPALPSWDLREDAVVEVRINPSAATSVEYPTDGVECSGVTALASTGGSIGGPLALGLGAVGLGALLGLVSFVRGRRDVKLRRRSSWTYS